MLQTLSRKKLRSTATYFFYPIGIVRIWKSGKRLWLKLAYSIIGLPIFLIVFSYFSIVLFSLFLPPLDLSIGNRSDRTLFNSDGNYSVTFLKTGNETNGAYELIKVELEPGGGNEWHYHKEFDETFTPVSGDFIIGYMGEEKLLKPGDSITAYRGQRHFFKNKSDTSTAVLMVKSTPAMGLEKSIRIGYGLANDGLFHTNGLTKNPWHMALLLGYSGSYLSDLPSFIQEPLVDALSKIAQWKGDDKVLEKYFR